MMGVGVEQRLLDRVIARRTSVITYLQQVVSTLYLC